MKIGALGVRMRPSYFALFALWIAASACGAQGLGWVNVTVLDENEKPVNSASVTADRVGVFADTSPMCMTGEDGICKISLSGPGRFEIRASRYYDGYPPQTAFYFGRNFMPAIITLAEKDSSTNVFIHVGPKQGFLKPIVTDAATGKEIIPVSFDFRWVSDPSNWEETGRAVGLLTLVPADVPLTMVACSEGYECWTYASPADPADHILLLHSGESRTLQIQLQPKH